MFSEIFQIYLASFAQEEPEMKIDVWNPVMPSSDRPVGYRPKCGGDRWWSSCSNKELEVDVFLPIFGQTHVIR